MKTPAPPFSVRAFSLVEVAIALGIVTFSVVAVLGLLPVGLSTFRDAADATIATQIVNQVASEVALMPFAEIAQYAEEGPKYFDNEGRLVKTELEAIYSAELVAAVPKYPGQPSDIESDLVNLQVTVTTARGQNMPAKVHNLYVARSDSPALQGVP